MEMIIDIDLLYAQNLTLYGASSLSISLKQNNSINTLLPDSLTAPDTYSVSGAILEAFRIDTALLNDDTLGTV